MAGNLNHHKSWHVFNRDNIQRVKRDEAAAAARDAAVEERMRHYDDLVRAALLRGEEPPPPPDFEDAEEERRKDREPGRRDRKRYKLKGEDDTDRDIRLARLQTIGSKDDETSGPPAQKKRTSNAPITDRAGHINLFPVDPTVSAREAKNAEAEAEKKRRERAFEDQYTMRFTNAAPDQKPWYAGSGEITKGLIKEPGKDVWGREDPGRRAREQTRMASTDPLAMMKAAQTQIKKNQEARRQWEVEQARRLKELAEEEERRERRAKRVKRDRAESVDSLEGFRLDSAAAPERADEGRREHRSSRRHRHRRSRSRSRDRHKDRERSSHRSARRSRSPDSHRERHSSHRRRSHHE